MIYSRALRNSYSITYCTNYRKNSNSEVLETQNVGKERPNKQLRIKMELHFSAAMWSSVFGTNRAHLISTVIITLLSIVHAEIKQA